MSGDKLIRTPVYRDMSLCHFATKKKKALKFSNKIKWNREFHTVVG